MAMQINVPYDLENEIEEIEESSALIQKISSQLQGKECHPIAHLRCQILLKFFYKKQIQNLHILKHSFLSNCYQELFSEDLDKMGEKLFFIKNASLPCFLNYGWRCILHDFQNIRLQKNRELSTCCME